MVLNYDCKKLDYYNLNDIKFAKEDSYISQIDLMIKQCLIAMYRNQTLAFETGHWSNIKCKLNVFSNFIKIK
jgi:hypothetical protein